MALHKSGISLSTALRIIGSASRLLTQSRTFFSSSIIGEDIDCMHLMMNDDEGVFVRKNF